MEILIISKLSDLYFLVSLYNAVVIYRPCVLSIIDNLQLTKTTEIKRIKSVRLKYPVLLRKINFLSVSRGILVNYLLKRRHW